MYETCNSVGEGLCILSVLSRDTLAKHPQCRGAVKWVRPLL